MATAVSPSIRNTPSPVAASNCDGPRPDGSSTDTSHQDWTVGLIPATGANDAFASRGMPGRSAAPAVWR